LCAVEEFGNDSTDMMKMCVGTCKKLGKSGKGWHYEVIDPEMWELEYDQMGGAPLALETGPRKMSMLRWAYKFACKHLYDFP
jgi:hypothetical protein